MIADNPFEWNELSIDSAYLRSLPIMVGVYALFVENELVYVGCSKNVKTRLLRHDKILMMKFKGIHNIVCRFIKAENFEQIELDLIKKYSPKLNKRNNDNRKTRAEIQVERANRGAIIQAESARISYKATAVRTLGYKPSGVMEDNKQHFGNGFSSPLSRAVSDLLPM